MERTTFCLLFYIRRTKLNWNGEAPIMMRITVNGVRGDASMKKSSGVLECGKRKGSGKEV